MNKVKETLQKNTMLIALVFIVALFQILIVAGDKGSLFTPANITNLISQNGYVVILAIGMLICILTGGNIDLSVGSMVGLVGALAGVFIVNLKMNIYFSIVLCLLVGLALGAWQAFWIAYIRIPSFIVTLAGMLSFRGIALIILNGQTISPFPAEYTRYFNSYLNPGEDMKMLVTMVIGAVVCTAIILVTVFSRVGKVRKGYQAEPIVWLILRLSILSAVIMTAFYFLGSDKGTPVILILLGLVIMAYTYFTSNTVPGRYLYAMGGNEKAASLSGVNTNRMLFFAYTNMGFIAAVTSLVVVARFNSSIPTAGESFEMDAIAACYIGGASAYGGVGTVGGAVIGAIFMGILNNGMSIMGVGANWQKAAKGLVLLAAVAFDVISKRRKKTA